MLTAKGPSEDNSWRELRLRIQRPLHRTHLLYALIAVKLPQQRLLHWVAPDAVLGERAAAQPGDGAAELEDRGLALHHVLIRSGDDVGVHVAVRDVAPHRVVEAAGLEALAVDL